MKKSLALRNRLAVFRLVFQNPEMEQIARDQAQTAFFRGALMKESSGRTCKTGELRRKTKATPVSSLPAQSPLSSPG